MGSIHKIDDALSSFCFCQVQARNLFFKGILLLRITLGWHHPHFPWTQYQARSGIDVLV